MPNGAEFEAEYFSEIYDGHYDQRNPAYKHRSYLGRVRAAVPSGRLLDVGCAYGAFLHQATAFYDCDGCDVSAHAVEVATSRVPRARIFKAGVLELPTDERYDVVTCFDVLEHVEEVDAALERIAGVLAPGGALVMTVPVYDTIVGQMVRRLDHDPTHVHKIARYDWIVKLGAAGFTVQDWQGILRYNLLSRYYIHWCQRAIRRFSPAILLIARPPVVAAHARLDGGGQNEVE